LTVVAVNGAIEWIPRADYFFTLDWADVNLHRLRNRREGVTYTAAFPLNKRWPEEDIKYYDRAGGHFTREPKPRDTPEWWLWRLSGKLGLSEDPKVINSGNSAYGALGLAYHLGFRDVALVGVDANTEPRVEGGRSKNLSHLPLLFASALKQLRVVSCGAMRGIPQMTFDEWAAEA
jgi:hypothetical protein